VMGLRVSAEEEVDGLDYGEHEMHAYDMGFGTHSSTGPLSSRGPKGGNQVEAPAE